MALVTKIHGGINLREGLILSNSGHHLSVATAEGQKYFYAHSEIDGIITKDAQILSIYNSEIRRIYQPDNSGTWIGQLLELVFPSTSHVMSSKYYYQTDTIAASAPVRIQIWQGVDNTGPILLDQRYSASQFPANTEIELIADSTIEYRDGTDYFLRYSSNEDFSFKMDATNSIMWLAVDVYDVRDDSLLEAKNYIDGDTYDRGDYIIVNRKIYNCNVTGAQVGTWESNFSKWDVLSTTSLIAPRITEEQRDALIPIGGMIIYNTSGGKDGGFNFYDKDEWNTVKLKKIKD